MEEKVIIRTIAAAAEYCGMSKRMISYHLGRGNLVQNPDGSFNKEDLDKYLKQKGRKPTLQGDDAFYRARLEKERYLSKKAERQRKELEVKAFLREVIYLDEVKKVMRQMNEAVSLGLDSLPSKIAPVLVGLEAKEIEARLRQEIFDMKKGLQIGEKKYGT
jgi:hypothetical protein